MDLLLDFLMLARQGIENHPIEFIFLVVGVGIIWKAITSEGKIAMMLTCIAGVCIVAAVGFYGWNSFSRPKLSAEEIDELSRHDEAMTANYNDAAAAMEYFFYDGGNLTEYYENAEKFLRFKAGQGFVEAQFYLGYMLDPKHTSIKRSYPALRQDINEAKNFYTMAADNNHMMAQFYLGNVYFDEKDYINAVKYYKLAADKGYSGARKALGYMSGLGYAAEAIDSAAYGKDYEEGFMLGMSER